WSILNHEHHPEECRKSAKCTVNTRAKPFDWKGQNKESMAVVLRLRVKRSFGATRTETISAGARKNKTRRCAGKNWKAQRVPISRDCRVGRVAPASECSQSCSMLSRLSVGRRSSCFVVLR